MVPHIQAGGAVPNVDALFAIGAAMAEQGQLPAIENP